MATFKCNKCDKEHTIDNYSIVIRGDKTLYVNSKSKKDFLCDCKKKGILILVEEPIKGFCTTFGKFASSSPNEKAKMLKKRSTAHYNKEIKENHKKMIDDAI